MRCHQLSPSDSCIRLACKKRGIVILQWPVLPVWDFNGMVQPAEPPVMELETMLSIELAGWWFGT